MSNFEALQAARAFGRTSAGMASWTTDEKMSDLWVKNTWEKGSNELMVE